MELRRIEDNVTRLKVSNKHESFLIKQLKFIGAVPVKSKHKEEIIKDVIDRSLEITGYSYEMC